MTNLKIIERLQNGDWFIVCNNLHETALVLNACIDANITWVLGGNIKNFDYGGEIKSIHCIKYFGGIYWNETTDGFLNNISDWFFEEISK